MHLVFQIALLDVYLMFSTIKIDSHNIIKTKLT